VKRKTTKSALIALILVCISSCENDRTATDKYIDFDFLHRQFLALDEEASTSQRDELLDSLVELAVKEHRVSPDNALESLMLAHSDDDLGLAMFERICAELENEEAALQVCERLQNATSASMVGLAAFHRALGVWARNDETRFLSECQRVLNSIPSTSKRFRVVLYARANYFHEQDRLKQAASDYMHFWSLYPEMAEKLAFSDSALPAIRNAGFLFEFHELSKMEYPTVPVDVWRFHVAQGDTPPEESGSSTDSCAAIYIERSPQRAALRTSLHEKPLDSPTESNAGIWARLFYLEREAQDIHGVVTALQAIRQLYQGAEEAPDPNSVPLLLFYAQSVLDGARDIDSWVLPDDLLSGGRVGGAMLKAQQEILAINSLYLDIAGSSAKSGQIGEHAFRRAIDRHVGVLDSFRVRKGVPEAFDTYVKLFPGSSESAEYIDRKARFYLEVLKSPGAAIDAYRQLLEGYPESKFSERASLKIVRLLYEGEKYEQAYENALLLLLESPENSLQQHAAIFYSGLALAAMGNEEDARHSMRMLVNDSPASVIASEALFWLATNALGEGKYRNARVLFEEFVQKYPDDRHTARAREYIEKLANANL
jgi:tetratricopeptide (TPR) repeat protein